MQEDFVARFCITASEMFYLRNAYSYILHVGVRGLSEVYKIQFFKIKVAQKNKKLAFSHSIQ